MAQLLTTITDALQLDYLPGLQDLLNNKNILSRWMERNETDFDGEKAYIALHTGRNQGIGARIEDGNLPEAQYQVINKVQFLMKNVYGRFAFTGVAKAASRGSNSYASVVDLEMTGLGRDLTRDANRMLFGNGTGNMATLGVTTASTTVVCTNTQNLKVNMDVDIITADTGAIVATNRRITSISTNTNFVINGSAITTTASDAVFRTAARNAEPYGIENAIGILDITSAGGDAATQGFGDSFTDFGEITKLGNTFWQGQSIDKAVGTADGAWDANDLQKAEDDVDVAGVGEVTLWITTHAAKRYYGNQLTPDKRFAGTGEVTLDGGYKALEFNGNPLVADRDCPKNKLYGLDVPSFVMFQMGDWNFMDEDGSILNRVTNRDKFEGVLRKYYNVGNKRPKGSILIDNILEAA